MSRGFCSDASLQGFAVAIAQLTAEECGPASRFRDRWGIFRTAVGRGDESALGMSAVYERLAPLSPRPLSPLDLSSVCMMISVSVV